MINESEGWIKIQRGIANHWLWNDAERLKWWIDMLFMANWEDKKWLDDAHLFTLKRGQIVASVSYLCVRWNKSNKTVIRFLTMLEQEDMITREIVHRQTPIITICNYDKYQYQDNRMVQRQNEQNEQDVQRQNEQNVQRQNDILTTSKSDNCNTVDNSGVQRQIQTQVHTLVHTLVHTNKEDKEIKKNSIYIVDGLQNEETPKDFGAQKYTSDNLEERKKGFANEIAKYKSIYTSEMLHDFYNYWTQCNAGSYRMLWEKERDKKAFAVPNRLATWNRNNNRKTDNYGNTSTVRKPFNEETLSAVVSAGFAMHEAESQRSNES